MTPRILGGLAALCLSAFLPRASALTVTQTASFNGGGSAAGYGPLSGPGGNWDFLPFNTALGTLQSVTFTVTTIATVTVFDFNYWATPLGPMGPMQFTPSVSMVSVAASNDGGGGLSATDSAGPTVTLQYMEGVNYTATLSTTIASLLTDGASLARYSDIGTWDGSLTPHRAIIGSTIRSSSYFGGVWGEGTATATITYHYEVHDSGNSGLLALGAFVGLLGVHRLTGSRTYRR